MSSVTININAPFSLLPNEINKEILSFCGERDRYNCLFVSKAFSRTASESIKENRLFVLKGIFSSYDNSKLPEEIKSDVETILKFPSQCGAKEIDFAKVEKFLKAQDILVLWQHLATKIGKPLVLPENTHNSMEFLLEQTKGFEKWYIEHLSSLQEITSIELNDKKLSSIDLPVFRNQPVLKNLTLIYAKNNYLTKIQLKEYEKLTVVFLSNNKLRKADFENLPELYEIYLDKNKFRNYSISMFRNISLINLKGNSSLESIELNNLAALKQLVLSQYEKKKVPITLQDVPNLDRKGFSLISEK